MRISNPTLLVLLAVAALHANAASAETVVLEPIKDGTLYESAAGVIANGAGNHFFAGQTGEPRLVRGLLEFDVAGRLPIGATLLSASLSLHMSRSLNNQETHTVSLHRVLEEWGEAGSMAPSGEGGGATVQEGDASWRNTFFPDGLWASLGGDFEPEESASTGVTGIGFYSWSSPELLADVQLFHERPLENHGWIVIGDESVPRAKRFDTRENPLAGRRPQLTIEFDPLWVPALEPAGLAMLSGLLVAAAAVRLRAGRSWPRGSAEPRNEPAQGA